MINIGETIISEPYMVISISSLIFTGIAFMMLILGGLFYLLNGLKREKNEEKFMMIGFAIYFFVTGIVAILTLYLYSQFDLIYVNGVFYGNFRDSNDFCHILIKIILILENFANLAIILPFERIMKRTKYLFSIIIIILVVVMSSLPYDSLVMVSGLTWTFAVLMIFLIIIFLAKWSPVEFKAISATLLFGMTMLALNSFLNNQDIKSLNAFPLELAPLFIIIGVIVCLSPTIINPKSFSHPLTYWYTFGFLEISILLGFTIFLLVSPIPFFILFAYIITDIFVIYFFIDVIKQIKSVQLEVSTTTPSVEREQRIELLRMFSRPQKLTEEEVSVSKEKKICLVCKGKVSGMSYICTECEAFYCINCAQALIKLENSCWVCETVIDDKKPSKFIEKDKIEEDDEVEKITENSNKK